ncbi:MAG: hypothetical protein KGV44_14525 [Flavobacteriaceae bacterium]|nr:hypothetical protein [Flavobacteriaceae bacterium]
MKKVLLPFIFGILLCFYSFTKIEKDKIRYFDENNVEISKSKFNRILSTSRLLEIPGDSINHKRLIVRKKRGKINNRALLELLLKQHTKQEIDSNKPIVVIYYPGKDACNSSGSATVESRQKWFALLEAGIKQIAQIKPIYIFKDNDGLEKYDGILSWYKDPEGLFERLFFQYHYPCSSFVVISKDGEFISYFGEFPKEYVWKATQLMNK